MEQATTTAKRAATTIETLPAELLEEILLYVVSDVVPPFITITGAYRCVTLEPSYVQDCLAFRLCSKKFRSLSWRALGHFLGETIFDLRSRMSFENLLAVSTCTDLAPWVQKLIIGCHEPAHPELWLHATSSDTVTMQQIAAITEDDVHWYPGAWLHRDGARFSIKDTALSPQEVEDHESILQLLTKALVSLGNLDHVRFYHEVHIPPSRYRRLFYENPDRGPQTPDDLPEVGANSGFVAHLGLEILLKALEQANICPRTMDLAVDLDEHHAFITPLSATTVAKACSAVRNLTLRNKYFPFYDCNYRNRRQPRIVLEKSLLPVLESLTLDQNNCAPSSFVPIAHLPSASNSLAITTLIVTGIGSIEGTILAFLATVADTLRHLTIFMPHLSEYKPLFNAIKRLNLETLDVPYRASDLWHHYNNGTASAIDDDLALDVLVNLPKHEFHWLLTDVSLRPSEFCQALEACWEVVENRKTTEGIEIGE